MGTVAFRRIVDFDEVVWHARGLWIDCSFDNKVDLQDRIIGGSKEDSSVITNGSSTDETREWSTEDISYSSSSIWDIIVDRRDAMINVSFSSLIE